MNATHYFKRFHDEAIDWSELDKGWLMTTDRTEIEVGDCLLFGDRRSQWFTVDGCDRMSNNRLMILFREYKGKV